MASLITFTKKMLVERCKRHMADGFPDASFSVLDNEILLYIDQALAYNLIGQVYANAKIEGNLCVPEAYMTTFQCAALQQDSVTREWYTTLPQPPISLPIGYSIDEGYFADSVNGKGINVFWIKQKRKAFRRNLPMPFGVLATVEGSKVKFQTSSGLNLHGNTFYVRMASTRTSSLTDTMDLPDDAIEMIFNNVVAKLTQRLQLPKDIVQDDISSGNKSS
jgi:hypothetical protein